MGILERIFRIEACGSTLRTECIAGLTSFMAMCYMIVVVPGMLSQTGMPHEAAVAATIWISALASIGMGLYARFPVGVAPGLGISAYFAYYICGPAGYSWQAGLGAVFISGVVFLLLTVTRLRHMIINAVPMDLKYAVVVGIGAFIAFIGLKSCGIIVPDPATFVALGDLGKAPALMAIVGLFLIGALMLLRVTGAMIIGIILLTIIGMFLGLCPGPGERLFSPELFAPTGLFLALDLSGALEHGLFSIVFTLTMVDLFDNMGVLIGLAQKAGFIAPDGQIRNLDRALLTDSVATMGSAVLGATTATSYLESAAGVAAGGRTGLTAVVIGLLFLLSLFIAPLLTLVPAFATAPVLIIVGALMMQEVVHIRFQDLAVALPAFLTIISMPLTFNIATGFGFGFVSWVGVRACCGRFSEMRPIMCIIALCFAINFMLRPH